MSYRLLTFEYAFRQVGFIVLLGIIVAAIAGLFSSGMVSDTVKTNSSKSLTIDYERFGRRETETRMAPRVSGANGGEVCPQHDQREQRCV